MTTIAHKDGIIAYDSQATAGQTIVNINHDKRILVEGVNFFITGKPAHFKQFIAAYFGSTEDIQDLDLGGLVYDTELFIITIYDNMYHKAPVGNIPYAIGSGADHAFTAMDCGCSAKEAVQMAVKRDTCTGGRIRSFKLK